jgi:hypothetical protein
MLFNAFTSVIGEDYNEEVKEEARSVGLCGSALYRMRRRKLGLFAFRFGQ